jgi:hypothetical protein
VDARLDETSQARETGAAALGRGGRMSRQRKSTAVLRLRQALLAFRETYNTTWLIERHGCLSPADYRRQQP